MGITCIIIFKYLCNFVNYVMLCCSYKNKRQLCLYFCSLGWIINVVGYRVLLGWLVNIAWINCLVGSFFWKEFCIYRSIMFGNCWVITLFYFLLANSGHQKMHLQCLKPAAWWVSLSHLNFAYFISGISILMSLELACLGCLLKTDLVLLILSYWCYSIDFCPVPEACVATLWPLAFRKETDLQPRPVQLTPRLWPEWSWSRAAFVPDLGPLSSWVSGERRCYTATLIGESEEVLVEVGVCLVGGMC